MTREESIMKRVREHYDEALEYFPEDKIVGVFLQGSQNYGLDYEDSDVDTKLITVPSFREICLNEDGELDFTEFQDVMFGSSSQQK
jgi:predicted nucleotidyltransferase